MTPRKNRRTLTPPPPPPGLPVDDETLVVDDVFGELPEEAHFIGLWRVPEQSGRPAYLKRYLRTEFTPDIVRDEFGGGRYEVRATDAANRFIVSRRFDVDGPPKRAPVPPPAPELLTAAAIGVPVVSIAERRLRRELRGLREAVTALAARPVTPPAPAADPLEIGLRIAEMVKSAAPPPPPASSTEAVLELLNKGMELGRKMASAGGDESDGFSKFAESVGGPLARLLDKSIDRDERIAAGLAAKPPAALPAGAPPPGAAKPMTPAAETAARVRPFAKTLQRWARREANAADKAAFVLDELSDAQLQDLAEQALADDFAEKVLAELPELNGAEFRPWMLEFFGSIRAELTEDDDGEDLEVGHELDAEAVGTANGGPP